MNTARAFVFEDIPPVAPELEPIREKALNGQRLSREDGLTLFQSPDVLGVGALAQWCAFRRHQRHVRYVVNGHINYSNFCTLSCVFCSFFRRKNQDRRSGGYEMSTEEVSHHADVIAASGATEIHIVGALHPSFQLSYYTDILKGMRQRHPHVGLKCFTATEIYHISALAKLSPIASMTSLIEERTGAKKGTFGSMFKLNPKVDDLPDEMGVTYQGVKLLLLGCIPQGGGGCFCPENVLLKNLVRHLLVQREEALIIDMEAGLEHLGRGSTGYVDGLIIVVEPGQRAINTARQIKKLGEDLRIKNTTIVGNKVTSDQDRQII
ncbi:MAG: radical SAM protein, partial [Planctomycetota bacterium]